MITREYYHGWYDAELTSCANPELRKVKVMLLDGKFYELLPIHDNVKFHLNPDSFVPLLEGQEEAEVTRK